MENANVIDSLLKRANEYGLLIEVVTTAINLASEPSTQSVVADTESGSLAVYCLEAACREWDV